jgi:hypothetical protein
MADYKGCKGTGKCSRCSGSGSGSHGFGRCQKCGGSGNCTVCKGSGKTRDASKLHSAIVTKLKQFRMN